MVESPNNIASSIMCVCPYHNLVRAPGVTNMQERGENGRSKKIEKWGQSYPFIAVYSPDYYFLTSSCQIIINLLTNVMPPISVY